MADSTLAAIRTKVRRLTRSPSTQQLSNATLDDYIFTFMQYDMPAHLRLFSTRTTFTFVTQPYVDEYQTNTTSTTDQFYDFRQKYITVHDPIYVAGYPAMFSQSREQFFGIYPIVQSIGSIGTGDASTTAFSGTLSSIPVMQNRVMFATIGTNNEQLALVDVPVVDANGNPTDDGNFYAPGSEPATAPTSVTAANTINYVTGVYAIDFAAQGTPASAAAVNSHTVPYVAARPQALLYYDDKIVVRPVPDQPYEISMEVYARIPELTDSSGASDTTLSPELEQWWQYIAYGASKKIFEDRMDMDSVQMIMPEFKTQERLALRRTLVQQSNERTATIYSEQTSLGAFSNNFPNGPY